MEVSGNGPAALCAVVLLALTLAGLAHAQATVPQSGSEITLSFAPLVDRTSPAVVNIYARKIVRTDSPAQALDGSAFWRLFRDSLLFGYGRERIENSLGSGVIVAADGIIVTNHHVAGSAEGIAVALADGRIFPARVLISDRRTDIAVLRIDTGGEPLPFIPFGDSDRLKVGDLVIAIGNPFGLGQTVTSGIVSALARTSLGIADLRFFIQTDAAINPGNSGGAQISMDGKLVGINTAIYSTTGGSQGLGFAVPSNMVRTIVDSAVRGKPLVRPWIGISGRRVPQQLARRLGLPQARGALITGLYAGGPAEMAGIAIGDVVVAVDDFPVEEFQALRYRIATRTAGGTVRLTLFRRGAQMQTNVALPPPPAEPPRNDTWLPAFSPLSGAMVASLSPALAEDIGLDSGISGVAVLEVAPGSAAENSGLRPGDVIRSFDGSPVRTVEELLAVRTQAFTPWSAGITRGNEEISIGRK